MTAAKQGDEIVVIYTVRTDDGRVVGGTDREEPQTLTLGGGDLIPRVDKGLTGMSPGEEKTVIVPPEEAFGPRRAELVMELPRERLTGIDEPKPGMQLSARQTDGRDVRLVVTEVSGATVTLDGNHPLAGETLHFALKVVDVKKAA